MAMETLVDGKYAVEYDEVDHIYRNVMATGGLMDRPSPPYYHVKGRTMAHLFDYMADEYEDKDAMGWRDVIKASSLTISFPRAIGCFWFFCSNRTLAFHLNGSKKKHLRSTKSRSSRRHQARSPENGSHMSCQTTTG